MAGSRPLHVLSPLQQTQPTRSYVEWSTSSANLSQWTEHEQLRTWILDRIRLLQPSRVHLCDGSEQENEEMLTSMVHAGTLIPLNPKLRPNSYLARSTTTDGQNNHTSVACCTMDMMVYNDRNETTARNFPVDEAESIY